MFHPMLSLHRIPQWLPTFIVLLSCSGLSGAKLPLHQQIDQQIQSKFSQWKVRASAQSTDAKFLRRAYLDLTGSIPKPSQTLAFLKSKATDKRERLIDQLLKSPEHAEHMATVFDVLLMERRASRYVTAQEWREYLRSSFAKNKPLDALAREILGADGISPELRPAAKFYLDRAVAKDTLVRDIGRLFLGVDLQCAQCHDHPTIDDYLHRHYHGLAVFVSGMKTYRQKDGKMVLQELFVPEAQFASVFDPARMQVTGPRLLNGPRMSVPKFEKGKEYVEKVTRKVRAVPLFSMQKLLAKKLPTAENQAFARNLANRLWAMMMGRGLVHPLDMHHAANPPSHPELLDILATQLVAMKFDARAFLRELAMSQTYQRSSLAPKGLSPEKVPPQSFAMANMKGLSPEQLFHTVLRATNSETVLAAEIEAKLQEDEENYQKLTSAPEKLKEAREAAREKRIQEFVSIFGGVAGSPKGEFQASLPQALFLANSETVAGWISPAKGNLTGELSTMTDAGKLANKLYLTVLSRLPTAEEKEGVKEHLQARGSKHHKAAVTELVWALIGSAELRLNH